MMPRDSDVYTVVYEFNQGAINDVAISPMHSYALTLGENGLIKVWDYVGKNVAYQ
jgi:WD40 repeat protein